MPAQTSIRQPTSPTSIRQSIGPRIEHRPIPFYPDLILKLPPSLPDLKDTRKDLLDLDTDRNITFEENSLYQEGVISETNEKLDKSYFKEPSELKDLIDTTKFVQRFPPKQTDIGKILDIIKRKVLKGTYLPITIIEIQAGYLTSPYLKDIYLYLAQNKLPSKEKCQTQSRNLSKKIDVTRFIIVQMGNYAR